MAYARTSPRPPSWAVLSTVLGAFLMVVSGGVVVAGEWMLARYDVAQEDLLGGTGAGYGEDITGPLDMLLVGIDTRPNRPEEPARADSVMIAHVNADLDRGYLVSLPRDLLVEIPPFEPTGYRGGRDRLNAAMYQGSKQVGDEELPSLQRGFRLLAETVGDLTGVQRWNAGAVIDFSGFEGVVDALGGVSLELEERIVSEHRKPDGSHRPPDPNADSYLGPQMVYEPGMPPCGPVGADGESFRCDLNGWQALDIARQRYSLPDGDFGRQRNQQLLLKAIMEKAFSRDVVTNPVALDRLVRAAGDSLVFDGRGNRAVDFAFALRGLRPGSLTTLRLPSTNVGSGDAYQGERLEPPAYRVFEALRRDRMASFAAANPALLG